MGWKDIVSAIDPKFSGKHLRAQEAKKRAKKVGEGLSEAESILSGFYAPNTQVTGTAFENLRADPQAVAAQRDAMARYGATLNQGGLTAADRGRLALANQQARMAARANMQALMNDYRSRGVGTQGSEIARMLQAQQAGADAAATQGREVASTAQNRYDQALQQSAALAGQVRGQASDEDMKRAAAMDMMNQYNAQQRGAQFDRDFAKRRAQYAARGSAVTGNFDAWKQGEGYQAAADQSVSNTAGSILGSIFGGKK